MSVTIREIAEIAKVSRGTVDRVLNNRPDVSEEVRERVLTIAKAMDYRPNLAGKALASQKSPLLIGAIIPPNDNALYEQVKNGMEAAKNNYKELGVDVLFYVLEDLSVQNQLQGIDYFINKKVDGLIVMAIDDPLIANKLNEASKNMPIVTVMSDIKNVEKLCFVGNDLEKSGRVSAELMAKLLSECGNIIIVVATMNYSAQQLRVKGFKDRIHEKYNDIHILEVLENSNSDRKSFDLIMEAFDKNSNIDGIYSATGLGIDGLGKALDIVDPEKSIKTVVYDLIPETAALLKCGRIDFTITQDPYFEGYMPIQVLADYILKGIRPEAENFLTKIDIRTAENIE